MIPAILIGVFIFSMVMLAWTLSPSGRKVHARAKAQTEAGKAAGARYCTKHQVVKYVPGGPDHLVWVYGPHRTQGNQCDGPEHRRGSGWW